MTNRVAIFCKSFRDDFRRLNNLVDSVEEFGGGIPLLISVPAADRELLHASVDIRDGVSVISDEEYVSGYGDLSSGWFHQQVCKLSVHRTGFASAYLSLDSDMYLIDNIDEDLFFFEKTIPNIVCSPLFTVFSKHNGDLIALVNGEKRPMRDCQARGGLDKFSETLANIRKELAIKPGPDVFARAPFILRLFGVEPGDAFMPTQILHDHILGALEDFLNRHNLSIADAISLSPWEYNWYACFANSAFSDHEIHAVRSSAICFPSDDAMIDAKNIGLTPAQIKCYFPIIATAARHYDAFRFD